MIKLMSTKDLRTICCRQMTWVNGTIMTKGPVTVDYMNFLTEALTELQSRGVNLSQKDFK